MGPNCRGEVDEGVELLQLARSCDRQKPGNGEFAGVGARARHDLSALNGRAARTLGSVSLAAILDRVLLTRAQEEPSLAPLRVELTGLECDGVHAPADNISPDALSAAMARVLADFLSLLGELTAEILAPAWHAGLAASPTTLKTARPDANQPEGDSGVKS